jgi:hypothetical protein
MQIVEDRRQRLPWWWWLVVSSFPIPFAGPWWLTVFCLAVFCLLVWAFHEDYGQRQ